MSTMKTLKAALETLSTVMVIVAASALIWSIFLKRPAAAPSPAAQDIKQTIATSYLKNSVGSGPIAIIEFSDFQCPFCARHAQETLPALKKALIDSGKARYAVVNLPLKMHAQAVPAAEAAECAAEQGKYWEMHDELFRRQQELAGADYASYAKEIGLDVGRFNTCLQADAALARVAADQKEAERLSVLSTPTLFIGRMRSDGGIDLLKRINGAASLQGLMDEVSKVVHDVSPTNIGT